MRTILTAILTYTPAIPALLAAILVTVPLKFALDQPPDGNGTMDSLAIWVAADPDSSLLFLTDKTRNTVEIHSPVTRAFLGRLGDEGTGAGQFSYPNGIAVAYDVDIGTGTTDVLFVVERDNARISAFTLPGTRFLGHLGVGSLLEPYGIAIYRTGGKLQAWITDNDGTDQVFVYDIQPANGMLTATETLVVETGGTLESIVIDPHWRRVYLCDESDNNNVMVYTLDGTFVQRFGVGRFTIDPEGIVLYDLGGGEGYIIVTDQNASPTEYEVFNRADYQWLGSFSGETSGTDGIAMTQLPLPNLPSGSFYAMNSDRLAHVYGWDDIAAALNLQVNTNPTLAVELVSFQARVQAGGVVLEWQTAAEQRHAGFHVYRQSRSESAARKLTGDLVTGAKRVAGGMLYRFEDRGARAGGAYDYWLADVDNSGRETLHGPIKVKMPLPSAPALRQNYPNPFNPETRIPFELDEAGPVRLEIYDVRGTRIRVLLDAELQAGTHDTTWDGRDTSGRLSASGIYFYTLETRTGRVRKKLVLAR